MGRLFLCGDTHGTLDLAKIYEKNFFIQNELTKNDTMIILGDTGICWDGGENDVTLQTFFESRNFSTLVVGGNHENYNIIRNLPIISKFGGEVYSLNSSISFAIRGEVYNFNGLNYLCIGGADSIDRDIRIPNESWWEQESLTLKEIDHAYENICKVDYDIEAILSHTSGSEVLRLFGYAPTQSDLNLDLILEDILPYVKHYCGHLHKDKVYLNHRILYNDIVEL